MERENFYLPPQKSIKANSGNWYKNIGYIGKGGNGTTFLVMCTDGENRGQIFALKVLHQVSSTQRIDRFMQEIDFLKGNRHPCILQHFDNGVYLDHPFLVMTYIPHTLGDELKKGIPFGHGVIYATQLLSALAYLHSKNVIHRDIKPQNIFINNCNAILGDFGLIKKLEEDQSDDDEFKAICNAKIETKEDFNGYIAMPQYYRTPELVGYAKNECQLHLKSDIFQLGLVLAQVFTGKNPLLPSNDMLDAIKLNPISKINCSYGGWLASTLKKMLDMNPNKRPSAETLLDDFTGIFAKYSEKRMALDGQMF